MTDAFNFSDAPSPRQSATRDPGNAPYLEALNPAQREAVELLDGPLLVLAGAGTGKTRVLTTRLAHVLMTGRAWPSQILAVTFTNKAAREMRERIEALIGGAADGLWLGTFHALAARILRRHAELVGLKPNFTILDQDDQIRLIKQLLEAANIDSQRWPARMLHTVIERWKDRGLTPDKVGTGESGDIAGGRLVALYAAYQERLKTLNAVDFGDLILHCLTLFTRHADVLADYQRRFKFILVDEYQDTNVAQYLWLRLLAQGQRNICCVGDDDQSIYGWRGAEVGNILRFEKDFPGARIVRLEQNYRSTGHILAVASALIARNEGRLGKTLWTAVEGGEKLTVCGYWDGEQEARAVADQIEALQRRGHALNEIAILVRAGFQTREFEERFIQVGLPYRVIGGPRFYERLEVRDAIAYLRVINQPDDDLAFERIVNKPRRGIGDATLQVVHRLARDRGLPLVLAAAALVDSDELKPRARGALGRLLGEFDRWRALASAVPHTQLAGTVLDESGYVEMWQNDKSPDAPGRIENLKELVRAMEEFDNLAGFLEHVSLVMEAAEQAGGDMVNLMTLHSAKGLEFDTVFLPGWEEGLFPHQRALDEGGATALEEERRLAHVGITRARHRVAISFAANRRVHNQWQSAIPSRFIDELPEEHVEVLTEGGLYGAHRRDERHAGAKMADRTPRLDDRWRRRHGGRTTGDGLVIEGARYAVEDDIVAEGRFVPGSRVFHQKFGYGTVAVVEGEKLQIDFDHTGLKRVIDCFVQPV